MHVLATAGHVDHGKSTLVRALTGIEPDRWAEERRRGMTIDLGFAWTALPSGAQIAFVDVPGHERFMTNMLAGVGGVPAVLFVVAADEGWRPQSDEHLAALDMFGVRHGLLAVTRADLADPAPVIADARARIAATSIGSVEAVAVSPVTGRGLGELRAALDRLIGQLPPPALDADVRLWVDRSFTITGRGTVVTGTLAAGTVRVGDDMELMPGRRRVRIRGLEALKQSRQEVAAVARIAVNLRGTGRDEVRRGDALVAPGRWLATSTLDALLSGGLGASELAGDLVLHIGSAAVPVRLRPLGEEHARLTLGRALPLRIGDVGLLRDPGQQLIVARLTALDVRPPRLTRRGAAAARVAELTGHDGTPNGADELRRRHIVRRCDLVAMGAEPVGTPVVGDWLADQDWWQAAKRRLSATVEHYATEHPTDPGMPVEVARRLLDLPDRRLVEALVAEPISYRGGRLFGSRCRPTLPTEVQQAVQAIQRELAGEPFLAPDADRLRDLGLDARLLSAAVQAGELLRVSDGVYLLPGADRAARDRLAELDHPFTVSEARQVLATTRRVAVPLLELLDQRGWTERLDDTHRRMCSAP